MNHGRYNDSVFTFIQCVLMMLMPLAIILLAVFNVGDNSPWWITVIAPFFAAIVNLMIWEKN